MKSQLISRNVTVNNRRTSLRLEKATWEALDQICACEKLTPHQICSMIEDIRFGSSRTSAVRAFIVTYFTLAAKSKKGLRPGTAKETVSLFRQTGN